MNENWEEIRAELIDQADQFRERHGVWKMGYYTAVLTISGIFIAACAISQPVGEVVRWIRILVVLVSIFCCWLTVSNIKVFVSLYDELGYGRTPKNPKEEDDIRNDLGDKLGSIQKKGKSRKRKDRAIYILFCINIILLTYSFVHASVLNIISCLRSANG